MKLFIQFYSDLGGAQHIELCNGFSDTYDFCKTQGDVIWLEHSPTKTHTEKCPIQKGTCYVSVSYISQYKRVYRWAKETPDVQFIMGGPFTSVPFKHKITLPNLVITNKSVEEWFGFENFSYPWKLVLPTEISETDMIQFTYSLDSRCYWNNCIFCITPKIKKRIRKNLKFEFKDLIHGGKRIVRFGTSALSPDMIKKMFSDFPNLRNIERIRTYLRPAAAEIEGLDQFESLPLMQFHIGLEIPTSRMWKILDKGYDLNESINLFNVCKRLQSRIHVSMILGWPNLKDSDLKELENYMSHVHPIIALKINALIALPGTQVHEMFEPEIVDEDEILYYGYTPKLSEKQRRLNYKALEIIKEHVDKYNIILVDHSNL